MSERRSTFLEHLEARIKKLVRGPQVGSFFFVVAGIAVGTGAIDLAVWFGLASLGFFLSYLRLRKDKPGKAPAFHPRTLITRAEKIDEIVKALGDERRSLLVLAGRSGAGKSVLVEHLRGRLRRAPSFKSVVIVDYGVDGLEVFEKEVRDLPSNRNALLVFDQLEKVFLVESTDGHSLTQTLLGYIELCQKRKGWKCLLVIRREWFLDLRVFGGFVPKPIEASVLDGLSGSREVKAYERFRALIVRILSGNESLAEAILEDCRRAYKKGLQPRAAAVESVSQKGTSSDELLPVEAITVAHALASRRIESVDEYKSLGRARGAMEVYFRSYLASFENKDTATSILASLSVNPRGHRRLSARHIAAITNLPLEEVEPVLEQLIGSGLLDTTAERHDWSHDFFAERFSEVSGTLLHPTNRDNIAYFWGKFAHNSEPPPSSLWQSSGSANRWGIACFVVAFLLLWLRPLTPLYDGLVGSEFALSPPNLLDASFLHTQNVDWSFLPIAFCLTGWSWYVTQLYRRVLARLHEESWRWLTSFLLAGWSSCLVVLSVLFPTLWVVCIGCGGIAVGLKYLEIAFRAQSRSMDREVFFGSAGALTLFNGILTVAGGLFYWAVLTPGLVQFNLPWGLGAVSPDVLETAMTAGATAIMLYFAKKVASLHINRKIAPIHVGTFQRYCRPS